MSVSSRKDNNQCRQESTSRKAASNAARVLSDPKSSKAAKSAAGSALTQVVKKK